VKVATLILVAETLLTRAFGLAAGAGDESAVAGGVATLESLAGRGGEGEEGGEEKEWRGGDVHRCLIIWVGERRDGVFNGDALKRTERGDKNMRRCGEEKQSKRAAKYCTPGRILPKPTCG
jgi:hypothetical protein